METAQSILLLDRRISLLEQVVVGERAVGSAETAKLLRELKSSLSLSVAVLESELRRIFQGLVDPRVFRLDLQPAPMTEKVAAVLSAQDDIVPDVGPLLERIRGLQRYIDLPPPPADTVDACGQMREETRRLRSLATCYLDRVRNVISTYNQLVGFVEDKVRSWNALLAIAESSEQTSGSAQ